MGNENSSSSSSNSTFKLLMNDQQRAQTLSIFKQQFQPNENFLRDTVLVKLRMKGKLMKVREKIMSRQNSAASGEGEGEGEQQSNTSNSNPMSPTTASLMNAAPIPSFANFADENSMKQKPTREEKIRDGVILLKERIQHLKLHMEQMEDDGNCQFRSIAHQLFGDQHEWHKKVRETIVSYMYKNKDEFSFLFEGEKDFNRYLGTMARDRTWGDELTLKAACNCYDVVIHVLTSEKEHYYVCYRPDSMTMSSSTPPTPTKQQQGGENDKEKEENKKHAPVEIFLAYISPIHYNSIRIVE